MVKQIKNFDIIYNQKIYPAHGQVYTIEKASIIKTNSEPQMIEYFDVKLFDIHSNHKPADYSIGIFYDSKNRMNLVCVYKRGESTPAYVDRGVLSIAFKYPEQFKKYVESLIDKI